jgi:hypothetical protein
MPSMRSSTIRIKEALSKIVIGARDKSLSCSSESFSKKEEISPQKPKSTMRLRRRDHKRESKSLQKKARLTVQRLKVPQETSALPQFESGEKIRRGRKPKALSIMVQEPVIVKAKVEPELLCPEDNVELGLIVKEEPSCIVMLEEEEPEVRRQTRSKKLKRAAKESASQMQATVLLASQSAPLKGVAVSVADDVKPCTCKNGRCAKKYCVCLKRAEKCDPSLCTCRDCENLDSPTAEARRQE